MRFLAALLAAITLHVAHAETIKFVDFDNWSNGTYTRSRLESDFSPLDGTVNGIDQGRLTIVDDPANSGRGKVLRGFHKEDEWGWSNGYQFGANFAGLDTAYLTYWMYVPSNWHEGVSLDGKLPGLCGGNCITGCNTATGTNGWSARLSFFGGEGAKVGLSVYPYHMDHADNRPCGDPTDFTKFPDVGVWFRVTQQVKMNDPGQYNGFIKTWLNDELVYDRQNMRFRSISNIKIDELRFEVFFGGSGQQYAPTQDTYFYYDDIHISTHYPTDESVFRAAHSPIPSPPAVVTATATPSAAAAPVQAQAPEEGKVYIRFR